MLLPVLAGAFATALKLGDFSEDWVLLLSAFMIVVVVGGGVEGCEGCGCCRQCKACARRQATRSIDDVQSAVSVQVQRQPQHRGPRSPTTRPPMFAKPGGPASSALARALAARSASHDRPFWQFANTLPREDLDDWG